MTSGPFRVVPFTSARRYSPVRIPGPTQAGPNVVGTQPGGGLPGPGSPGAAEGQVRGMAGLDSGGPAALLKSAGLPAAGSFLQQLGNLLNNPAGAGTKLGAVLEQTGAGRGVMQHIGAQHAGPGASYGSLFEPGGRFYGRATGSQAVSTKSYLDQFWAKHETLRSDLHAGAKAVFVGSVSAVAGLLAAAVVPDDPPLAKAIVVGSNRLTAGVLASEWVKNKYPVGPGGPVSPAPNLGYYPSGAGAGQSSGSGSLSLLDQLALAEYLKRMKQQAHSREDSDSGGGGEGTSMAPESVVLRGMRYPEEWVAIRRVG